MALVQETGTGVAGSNSYVTAAEVKAFIGTIALPAATDSEIERAAILATRYLDGKYRDRWKGTRTVPTIQPLEWPRLAVNVGTGYIPGQYVVDRQALYYYPSSQIPQEIKDATCELALRALIAPLAADIAATDRVKRKKIDVLETEYVTGNFQPSYPAVDQLISRFLRSGNDAIRG